MSLHELTFLAYAASKQEGRGLGKCMTLGGRCGVVGPQMEWVTERLDP
jgi:hypothetical protein